MTRMIAGLMLMGLTFAVLAASPAEVRRRAEASMVVTGWIEVMPDGSVHSYTIDHPEKLPPAVVSLIQNNVPAWKFKVDGNPQVIERAQMNLRIVARRVDDTHDTVAIASTNFDRPFVPGQSPASKDRVAPKYPQEAINARVTGTVFLLVRVGRDGTVMNAGVEQVNLGEYGNDRDMEHYSAVLANSAIAAAKQWTFTIPTSGPTANDPFWYVRVPVNYNLQQYGSPPAKDLYGKWDVYIPGPREVIPWLQPDIRQPAQSSDAIPAGSISQADENLHLQTQPSG
ncbi:energy transducer TonB [Dyella dinghuensis]|uniref:Energy transducer TonB n=1 Tax=Dyella dinghuensis TaxID=1920169 RepID=A0A3S0S484_9GAMM|nr:energy transducer TonB [Dyella dinghuensis]RUL64473.1 energy transducer TonB [Dyella dinghuensis]